MHEQAGKPYFPLFFNLEKKDILFVGAGSIGLRRIEALMPFVQRLSVITKETSENLKVLQQEHPGIQVSEKCFEETDLEGRDIVFACTDDRELNGKIAAICKTRGILVNNCSKKEDCDFYFPGILRKEGVVVGVTASGENHGKAKAIREKFQDVLDEMLT